MATVSSRRGLNVLFVSTTCTGGSGHAQREFAQRLMDRGHVVELVHAKSGRCTRREIYKYVRAAAHRLEGIRLLAAPLRRTQAWIGRRPRRTTIDGIQCWESAVPENTYTWLRRRGFAPDVVVTHTLHPRSWSELHDALRREGVPCAYFVHEAVSLSHLVSSRKLPDRILAGARTHVTRAADMGLEAEHVPRIVDTGPTTTETTREVALLVNPVRTHGIDVLWHLAAARPDVRFVLQESWELSDEQLTELRRRTADLPNVMLRRRQQRRDLIYRDAKVLLAPHQVDNNPRVVVEAQANGIPVLGSDFPGLVEVVGDGGVLVPADADVEAWEHAFRSIWDDERSYASFSERAVAHAAHADSDPDLVAQRLESVLDELAATSLPPSRRRRD